MGDTTMGGGLRWVHLTLRAAEAWRGLPADTRFVGLGFAEPSLVFYSHRKWEFTGNRASMDLIAKEAGPLVVVTLEREIDPARFWQSPERQKWGKPRGEVFSPTGDGWTRETVSGFNVGRTRWQELTVWTRK